MRTKVTKKPTEKEPHVDASEIPTARTLMVAFALFLVINVLVIVFVLHSSNDTVLAGIGKIISTATREQPSTTPSPSSGESEIDHSKAEPIILDGLNWTSFFVHYPATWSCAGQIKNAIQEIPGLSINEDLADEPDDEDPIGFYHVLVNPEQLTKVDLQRQLGVMGSKHANCLESTTYPLGKQSVKLENIPETILSFASDDEEEDNENDWIEEDEQLSKYNLSQSIPLIQADVVHMGYGTFGANDGTGVNECIVDAKINGTLHTDDDFVVEYGVKAKKFGYPYVVGGPGEDLHAEYLVQTIAPKDDSTSGVAPGVNLMIVSLSSLSKKSDLLTGFVKGCTRNKMGPNKANIVYDVMVTGANLGEIGGKIYTTPKQAISGKGNIKAVNKTFIKYSRHNYKKKENNTSTSPKYNPRKRPIFVSAGQNFSTTEGVYNKLAALESVIAVGAVADNTSIIYNPTVGTLSCSSGPLAPNKSLCDSACSSMIDIAAPGFEITISSGDTIFGGFGTSVAAAHAAGVAALMIAKPKPEILTTAKMTDILKASATNHASLFGQKPVCQGAGVINAKLAVEAS